jgi:hypothetical protein
MERHTVGTEHVIVQLQTQAQQIRNRIAMLVEASCVVGANDARASHELLLRGGAREEPYQVEKITEVGVSTTTSWETAHEFGDRIQRFALAKHAKVLRWVDIPKADRARLLGIESGKLPDNPEGLWDVGVEYAKERGYDVLDMTTWGEEEFRVFNPKVLQTLRERTRYMNRTGLLTQSIASGLLDNTPERVVGFISANREYAWWVEVGTRRSKPYPYLFPGLLVAAEDLKQRVAKT